MAKTLAELDAEFRNRKKSRAPQSKQKLSVATPAAPPAEPALPLPTMAEIMTDIQCDTTPAPAFIQLERGQSLAELDELFRVHSKTEPNKPEPIAAEAAPEVYQNIQSSEQGVYRRFFSAFSNVVFYIAILAVVLAAYLVSKNGPTMIGGLQVASILSGSMESVYPKGSLILIREFDPNELMIGNDITFSSASYSANITHRIVDIHENYNNTGERGFVTRGVNNDSSDRDIVLAQDIVGKIVFFIPGLGELLQILQERLHLVIIFFVSGVGLSLFLNLTFGETAKERKIRKAKAVLRDAKILV